MAEDLKAIFNRLEMLAGCGMPKAALLAFIDHSDLKLAADHRHFLMAPIVQHKNDWMDTTPEWMYPQAYAERYRIVQYEHSKGIKGYTVGATELAVAMYPATMASPVTRTFAEVYLWASAHAYNRHSGKSLKEIFDNVGGVIPDHELLKPGGRLHQDYTTYCSEIRRRVVKAGAERAKEWRTNTPRPPPEPEVILQPSLFDFTQPQ